MKPYALNMKERLGLNKVEYQEDSTGIVFNENESVMKLMTEYYKLAHLLNYTSLEMFKAKFGPQKTCKTYTRRCWIWTFCKDGVIIYCIVSDETPSWESPTPNDPQTKEFLEEILGEICYE